MERKVSIWTVSLVLLSSYRHVRILGNGIDGPEIDSLLYTYLGIGFAFTKIKIKKFANPLTNHKMWERERNWNVNER